VGHHCLEGVEETGQQGRHDLDEPDALTDVAVEALPVPEALLERLRGVRARGGAQELQRRRDGLAGLTEDEARPQQVGQLAHREVVGMLARQPDRSVVLAAVPHALDDQVLAVR